jgi:hypothetical protein
MTAAPINTMPGADPDIVRSLLKIRQSTGPLPAFNRGQMFYDFDLGKVRVAAAPSSADRSAA